MAASLLAVTAVLVAGACARDDTTAPAPPRPTTTPAAPTTTSGTGPVDTVPAPVDPPGPWQPVLELSSCAAPGLELGIPVPVDTQHPLPLVCDDSSGPAAVSWLQRVPGADRVWLLWAGSRGGGQSTTVEPSEDPTQFVATRTSAHPTCAVTMDVPRPYLVLVASPAAPRLTVDEVVGDPCQ